MNLKLERALLKLRKELNYKPIGYNIILGKKLNRGNFYRKMIGYNILDNMDEPRWMEVPIRHPIYIGLI